jgi:hypothetical protein
MKIITKKIMTALSAVIVAVPLLLPIGDTEAAARISAAVWVSNATNNNWPIRNVAYSYLSGYVLAIGDLCGGLGSWPRHPHDVVEDFVKYIQEDLPAGDKSAQVFYALHQYFWATGVFTEETSCRMPSVLLR